MNVTGQRTVQAQVFQHHFPYLFNSCFCMAQERSFTNSCCSKTIIRDQNLLKNIRPLKVPARMAGLTGIKTITQADMYQLDKNIDCTMTTITMARVYYDPTVKYSLVSMAELASLNFQFRFGKHQSSVRKPAEINTCAACPHFQRLCNRFNWNPEFFCSRFHQQNDKRGDGASILQSCNKRGQAHSSF